MLILQILKSKLLCTTQKQVKAASRGAPYVIARRFLHALVAVCRAAVMPGQRVLHASSQSGSHIPLTGTCFASASALQEIAFTKATQVGRQQNLLQVIHARGVFAVSTNTVLFVHEAPL